MRIRKFKKEDARKVSSLIRKCLRDVNSKDYSSKVIKFMIGHFSAKKILEKSKERETYVTVDDEKLLGTATLKDDVILSVFVHPDYHGQGIGTGLMKKVEKEAKKKGHKTIKLPSSITALGFYEKLGYRKVKVKYEKNFGKNIIMKKKL